MFVLGKELIADFQRKHADARERIDAWLLETKSARWTTPQDVKNRHQSASFLPENVVIFNVKGIRYRLECKINYRRQAVSVRWIGTHAEYSRRHR